MSIEIEWSYIWKVTKPLCRKLKHVTFIMRRFLLSVAFLSFVCTRVLTKRR